MINKLWKDLEYQEMKQYLHSEMEEFLLKNILKNQDILNIKYLEMNMEIMFICLKENAQFKEEIKKLLKKHHHPQWILKQGIKWVPKLLC
jgi:cupin superfamily acireductone dioxygenase involved in methionine salvage